MIIFRKILFISLLAILGCGSNTLEPAPGVTIINYNLVENSHVKIIVVNAYETIVATLIERDEDAGEHSVNFAPSQYNLIEGIYFLKIFVNDKEIKQYKLTMIKQ